MIIPFRVACVQQARIFSEAIARLPWHDGLVHVAVIAGPGAKEGIGEWDSPREAAA